MNCEQLSATIALEHAHAYPVDKCLLLVLGREGLGNRVHCRRCCGIMILQSKDSGGSRLDVEVVIERGRRRRVQRR